MFLDPLFEFGLTFHQMLLQLAFHPLSTSYLTLIKLQRRSMNRKSWKKCIETHTTCISQISITNLMKTQISYCITSHFNSFCFVIQQYFYTTPGPSEHNSHILLLSHCSHKSEQNYCKSFKKVVINTLLLPF